MKNNFVSQVEISNPDKIIYSNLKIKKLGIAKYYEDISDKMLPFLNKRLISVIRCHSGVNDKCFFKKHPTTEVNNVEVFNDKNEEYFYIKNKKQLVYQSQMGSIEIHTWGSRIPYINKPDIMVFDLDPDKNLSLTKLRQGVIHLKQVLDELNLTSFLKTSGGKGYHIVVPFKPCRNWKIFNAFSKMVAELLEHKYPDLYTTNIRKSERNGKIFIDWLRNSKGATCIAPYSLRARETASISWPIDWEDLNTIKPDQITIKNYNKYLNKKTWQNFFDVEQQLK